MNECDIYVAEEILKRLKNRNGCVTGVDIEELVTDEAQYYRICCSLQLWRGYKRQYRA